MQLPTDSRDPLANHERYETKGYLGRGAHGLVVKAWDKRSNEMYAIKLLKRGEISKYVESEIVNHSKLRHLHIVQLKKVFLTREYICLVMEFASAGNLFHYVRGSPQGRLMERVARFFFQQLIMAVDYCHERGIVNRDIKLENILLHHTDQLPLPYLKICDFGFSKSNVRSAPKTRVGTWAYMAPEVLQNRDGDEYDGKLADVWSCGVVLYAMLCGGFPFPQIQGTQNFAELVYTLTHTPIPLPANVPISTDCRDLLLRMLQPDPNRRITVKDILMHPWYLTNLPPNASTITQIALRDASSTNVALAVEKVKRMLRQARQRATPNVQEDEEMSDVDIGVTGTDEGQSLSAGMPLCDLAGKMSL